MFDNLLKSLEFIPTNALTMLRTKSYLAWKKYFFTVL